MAEKRKANIILKESKTKEISGEQYFMSSVLDEDLVLLTIKILTYDKALPAEKAVEFLNLLLELKSSKTVKNIEKQEDLELLVTGIKLLFGDNIDKFEKPENEKKHAVTENFIMQAVITWAAVLSMCPDSVLDKLSTPKNKLDFRFINAMAYLGWILANGFERAKEFIHLLKKDALQDLLTQISTTTNEMGDYLNTDLNQKKILNKESHKKIIFRNNDLSILDLLSKRGNYKISPNKKYTAAMFEHTESILSKHKKNTDAYMETLANYGLNVSDFDTYGRRFRDRRKNKKK